MHYADMTHFPKGLLRRRSMKKIVNFILSILPLTVSKHLIRRKYDWSMSPPSNMTFEIAETRDSYEQAFKLVQQSYKDINIVDQAAGEFRITKHHALPTTTVIVAKIGDKVIATVSIISKIQFSLPMEELFDISKVSERGRTCEISCLAIHRDYRRLTGKISLPLMIFLFKYSYQTLGNTIMVFCVHPRASIFYQALFDFKKISKQVKSYSSVNNAPALALYCDMSHFGNKHKKHSNKHHRMLTSLVNTDFRWMKTPQGRYNFPVGRILREDLFNYFFIEKSSVFMSLPTEEKEVLREIYQIKDKKYPDDKNKYYLYIFSRLYINDKLIDLSTIYLTQKYISAKIYTSEVIPMKAEGILQIDLSRYESLTLNVKVVTDKNNLKLNIEDSLEWRNFIDYLHSEIQTEEKMAA